MKNYLIRNRCLTNRGNLNSRTNRKWCNKKWITRSRLCKMRCSKWRPRKRIVKTEGPWELLTSKRRSATVPNQKEKTNNFKSKTSLVQEQLAPETVLQTMLLLQEQIRNLLIISTRWFNKISSKPPKIRFRQLQPLKSKTKISQRWIRMALMPSMTLLRSRKNRSRILLMSKNLYKRRKITPNN